MPSGKVRFFDEEKGYGFIEQDGGQQVFLHASALPDGAQSIKKGTRVEFSVVEGKRGAQAMTVKVIDAPGRIKQVDRKPADQMVIIVEDLIRVLDDIKTGYEAGRHPAEANGKQVAALLRKVAQEISE